MTTNTNHLVDGKYGIADLVSIDRLRTICEKFTQATGFTIGLLDHPGLNVLVATGWRDICTRFHRGCPRSTAVCIESNRRLLCRLREPGQIVIDQCDHGLVDCATPVIVKGKHIASLSTGQLLLKPPDLERFRAQARCFGYNEADYLKALAAIPVVAEDTLRAVTSFMGEIALIISELGYANLEIRLKAATLEEEVARRKRDEAALRESEERFRALVENLPVGISVMNPDMTFAYLNPAFTEILGYTAADIPDKPTWFQKAYSDAATRERAQTAWKEDFLDRPEIGMTKLRRFTVRCKDGTDKAVSIRALLAPQKQVIQVYTDTTDMMRAQAQMVQYQEDLRRLGAEVAMSEERERHRLATSLHDGLGQSLILCKMKLDQAETALSETEHAHVLTEIAALLAEGIRGTREITFQLSLPVLYEIGLEAALEWLAEQVDERHGLPVTLNRQGATRHLPIALRVTLFQSIRELILNTVKHAQARSAQIDLTYGDDTLTVVVSDDGRGFDTSRLDLKEKRHDGFGLFSVRERLRFQDGSLTMQSPPGHGTRGTIVVPLETAVAGAVPASLTATASLR